MTKPVEILGAMKSMVSGLQEDLEEVEASGHIDPFMLAANVCDRFVNIHPFKDANGRMSRLILNAVLIRYAGVVIPLGEKTKIVQTIYRLHKRVANLAGIRANLGPWSLKRPVAPSRRCLEL